MINNENYFKIIITIFILIAVFIWSTKPKFIFTNDGQMKPYGVGVNKTILYYPYLICVIAIIIYIIIYSLKKK